MSPEELFRILFDHFGPQHWWPGETPFEVAIGAILTQNTAWTNVEKAIANLKEENCLSPECIAASRKLEEMIRPAGYYNQKSRYLRNFCQHLLDNHQGRIEVMLDKTLDTARKELLQLKGIGSETADSILLYAGNHPTFVVDAYTIRIGQRIGLFNTCKYHEVKEYFESRMKPDAESYNEFHALFVALGKAYCRAGEPDCESCPLKEECEQSRKTAEPDYQ